jgi:hypothetical protein
MAATPLPDYCRPAPLADNQRGETLRMMPVKLSAGVPSAVINPRTNTVLPPPRVT